MTHAVLAHLKLSNEAFGSEADQEAIYALADTLADALDDSDIGDYDGEELGEGGCVLFMYGDDADKLFDTVAPILKSSKLSKGGYVIKRYGDEDDAAEVRVDL